MRLDNFREAIGLAFEELTENKVRSGLTILGIVVGVATVMSMSALITGIRSSIMEAVEASGPNNFIVTRFDLDQVRLTSPGRHPDWLDNVGVSPAEARQIASLDMVADAIVNGSTMATISVGKDIVEGVQISASGAGWRNYTSGTLVAGRDFTHAEVRAARPVIVISSPLAEALFGALDPIGRTVQAGGTRFTVIGIFDISGNIFSGIVKHFAVVPYTAGIRYLDVNPDWLDLLVVTADHAHPDKAIDQVITTLRVLRGLRPGEPNDFAIMRSETMIETFDNLTGIFFAVMISLSSIGLIVGGVGVIAIMMISVTERTREIGIRKAIGATRQVLLWQFLIEATTVTIVGGVIGMICGGFVALLTNILTPIPATVPLWAIAAALLMAVVAGIIFGLWPAWRASRLDPVVALRYE